MGQRNILISPQKTYRLSSLVYSVFHYLPPSGSPLSSSSWALTTSGLRSPLYCMAKHVSPEGQPSTDLPRKAASIVSADAVFDSRPRRSHRAQADNIPTRSYASGPIAVPKFMNMYHRNCHYIVLPSCQTTIMDIECHFVVCLNNLFAISSPLFSLVVSIGQNSIQFPLGLTLLADRRRWSRR